MCIKGLLYLQQPCDLFWAYMTFFNFKSVLYVSFSFVTTFKPIYQFTLHFESNWNLLIFLGLWQHDILNQIRLQWLFWGVTMWQFQRFWWLIHISSWSCVEMIGSNKLLKDFITKCEIEKKKKIALKMKNQKQGKNNIYTKTSTSNGQFFAFEHHDSYLESTFCTL